VDQQSAGSRESERTDVDGERPAGTTDDPPAREQGCEADQDGSDRAREEQAPDRGAVRLEGRDRWNRRVDEVGEREQRETCGEDQLVEEAESPESTQHKECGR